MSSSLSLIPAQQMIASLSAIATIRYSKATPADPTLNWIALEFKPTLAIGWLILAVLSACTLVYGFSEGAPCLDNLGVGAPENNPPPNTMDLRNVTVVATAFLRVGVMVQGALASFILFQYGVPWPRTGDTLDGVAAFALYFAHGLVNCLAICTVGISAYYLAVGGAAVLSDSDAMTDNLEKGAEKN
ncbi:hypothetical protein MVEN_00255300 [Mycena venus]|uniref:Uncharacterized protein n=1 Tax=Mycena venus TaxID=2733690 RepID=A0A8H6Z3P0_9AGAR|nr:hypothetical protein MVEN_00255300 [Mycena venus]